MRNGKRDEEKEKKDERKEEKNDGGEEVKIKEKEAREEDR